MIYEIYTENGTKKKRALTGNGYGLPLGTWISYEGTCPDGFIESEQTFNTTTYASLYAMLGTNKVPARFDHSVLSDYEDIQSSVPITLQNGVPLPKADSYIVPYDGFITLGGNGTPYNLVLFVNGEVGLSFYGTNGGWSTPVKKGDYVSISSGPTILFVKARYYKRHLAIKATPAYVEPDTVSDMVNTLRTQDSYSTSEVNTGKKWIDGKPIYSRVLQGNVIPGNGTTAIENVSRIIKQEGYLKEDNIWYVGGRGQFNLTLNEQTHNVLYYFIYGAGTSYDWYFTIEYTKTTD